MKKSRKKIDNIFNEEKKHQINLSWFTLNKNKPIQQDKLKIKKEDDVQIKVTSRKLKGEDSSPKNVIFLFFCSNLIFIKLILGSF
jgi:rubrerythrin